MGWGEGGLGLGRVGRAGQIKQILKSSWQLNKTTQRQSVMARCSRAGLTLSSGFVHVLVSQAFHLPPRPEESG